MSQKITSKNLSYDTSLPPFLAALQARAAGATGPDPLLAAQRRASKKRTGSEEAEDAPVVVDENGNTVALDVDEDGAVRGGEDKRTEDLGPSAEATTVAAKHEDKAAIGGRKRKVGKVIGDTADPKTKKADKDVDKELPKDRKPKKAKKIKLSFDEDDG